MIKIQTLLARLRDDNDGLDVSVPRKVYEILYLYCKRGFGPGYYFEAGLSRRDRDMTFKSGFYGHKDYARRVDELNEPRYNKISQNKLSEAAVFAALGIPSPRTFGHLCVTRGLDFRGRPLRTGSDLLRLITEERISRFCSKEVEGWNGRGFIGAEVVRKGDTVDHLRLLDTGETVSCDEYVSRFGQYAPQGNRILQDYFQQHPVMSALNPSSVNTIRVMVFQPASGEPRAFGAFARMGRAGSLVDNVGAGGFWAVADMHSGRLRPGKRPNQKQSYYRHPDHDSAIDGVVVPYWEQVKEIACKTLSAFPHTRYLGVDVAVGPDGPIIIEVNTRPDYIDFAILEMPTEETLQD